MNGEIVEWKDATVHVSAHALHYGSGVFEGIRSYETDAGPAVFRLDAHLDRLFYSAGIYGMTLPYSQGEIEAAICETVRRNRFGDCYIRPLCFLGSRVLTLYPRDCPVNVAVLAWPWGAYLGNEALENGVRVTISPWVKFHSSMMPASAKGCGQYLNSTLAVRDAIARGYDEALLLDSDGNIAEGSGENLFIIKDGVIATNDERSSILMGITRDSVVEIARDLGYAVEIRAISLQDLLDADEAFFTGTAAEVTPIREVDGSGVGTGARGPITALIQRTFLAACHGREPRYRRWLRMVDTAAGPHSSEGSSSTPREDVAAHT